MPESTMAIVGVATEDPPDQNFWTPDTKGQRCLLESPVRTTGASVVIDSMPLRRASVRICRPVSCAAVALINE